MMCLKLFRFQFYFVLQLKYFISVLSGEQNVTNSLFILTEESILFTCLYLLLIFIYLLIHKFFQCGWQILSNWKGVASQSLLPHYLWRSHFCFFILLKIQTCAMIKHEPGDTELSAVLGNSLNKNNWLAGGNPVFLLICETSCGVSLSPNLKWDFAEGFTILSVCTGQDWHSLGHIHVALC